MKFTVQEFLAFIVALVCTAGCVFGMFRFSFFKGIEFIFKALLGG